MTWKEQLHSIIFGTETRAAKLFDLALLWVILASALVVVLESIPEYQDRYPHLFFIAECVFTGLFTVEYILRVVISPKPMRYVLSVWGIFDMMAILPFYLGLIVEGYHYLLVLRLFRLLRVFRILKLFRFINEAQYLFHALRASAYKIGVFISGVLTIVILLGTVMYVIEGSERGFTSIPQSIYWTIVTITTVGYGDITPQSPLGKFFASIIMLCGYAIIAIPTGIVTVEMSRQRKESMTLCPTCGHANPHDSKFCNACGQRVNKTDANAI